MGPMLVTSLATFVFDKRGTGRSDGEYTQDFSLLASDVIAASTLSASFPSYWLFAGEDASQPTEASVANLERLARAGKPVRYKIDPDTSHGIMVYEQGEGRQRNFLAYHPDYYSDLINWLKEQVVSH